MLSEQLAEFLDHLKAHPDEMYVYDEGSKAAVYAPETSVIMFLDGDFTGDTESCNTELQRVLREDHRSVVTISTKVDVVREGTSGPGWPD